MKGICLLTQIPLRKQPSHRSEMTSQLLFGELFDIVEENSGFLKIVNDWDQYEGWIDKNQAFVLSVKEQDRLATLKKTIIAGPFLKIMVRGETNMHLPAGAELFLTKDNHFEIGELAFKVDYVDDETGRDPARIPDTAHKFLNSPYLWGGRTCFGIDCSGFTQVLFKTAGISIPRDASEQVHSGESVGLLADAKPGDLAFFDDEEGNIVHVGMLISDESIIHSSGRVRLDTIDHQGIFNRELGRYTHKLRTIRRVFPEKLT